MCREAVSIQSRYYLFGIELGLPLREMEAIQKAFQLDIAQAFTTVLIRWLRHSYDVKRYGPPTWRRLVEAVDSPAGGNNHALAKTIAENHPVKEPARSQSSDTPIAEQHSPAAVRVPATETGTVAGRMVNSSAGGDSCREADELQWPAPEETPATESTHAVDATFTKLYHKGMVANKKARVHRPCYYDILIPKHEC